MKIAIFVKNERLNDSNNNSMRALIFNVEDEKIIGMEDAYLYNMDTNYISLWLISRQIYVFYIRNIEEYARCFLKKIGIIAKTFNEIDHNHILGLLLNNTTESL